MPISEVANFAGSSVACTGLLPLCDSEAVNFLNMFGKGIRRQVAKCGSAEPRVLEAADRRCHAACPNHRCEMKRVQPAGLNDLAVFLDEAAYGVVKQIDTRFRWWGRSRTPFAVTTMGRLTNCGCTTTKSSNSSRYRRRLSRQLDKLSSICSQAGSGQT